MQDSEELIVMLNDCIVRKGKMTAWEKNFFQAIFDKIAKHLSLAQREKIEKLWEQLTTRQTGATRT